MGKIIDHSQQNILFEKFSIVLVDFILGKNVNFLVSYFKKQTTKTSKEKINKQKSKVF